MQLIYQIIGRLLFWGTATFWVGFGIYWLWQRRPQTSFERRVKNAFGWVQVFVFRRRWHIRLESARLLLTAYRGHGRLDSWERDIIAAIFRHNRRIGWKQN